MFGSSCLPSLVLVSATFLAIASVAVAQPVVGLGAIGDSYVDEYQFAGTRSTARGFVEQLAQHRSVNLGQFRSTSQTSWGAPRNFGYQYNWAQGGSTTLTAIQGGQHTGLAAQVTAGQVNYAVIATGGNDFALPANYTNIYSGALSGAALTTYINNTVSQVLTIHDTVRNAGANTVLVNIGDLSNSRELQTAFSDPVSRARVTLAISQANSQLLAAATNRNVPLIDVFQFGQLLNGNSPTNNTVNISGVVMETWNFTNGVSNPDHWFEDNVHAGSVYHGLYSNMIMKGMNYYGANLAPFTDQVIFTNAGLTSFPAGPTYFNIDSFVIQPVPEPSGLLLLAAPLAMWRFRRKCLLAA